MGFGMRMKLEQILNKQRARMWKWCMWLRISSSSESLWKR